jgi:multimeric flavodoxin WrbA
MKVIALNGSPRADGNTAFLLKCVGQELEAEGIETDFVQLGGVNIRGCGACYKCQGNKDRRCSVDDEANNIIARMAEADGILIGSPTYFTDVTTEVKALIDRAGFVSRANGNMFRRKVGAAVIAVRRAGSTHAFDTINHFFLIGEMIVPGSIYWNMSLAGKKGESENDAEGIRTMQALGRNMAWLLKKLQPEG